MKKSKILGAVLLLAMFSSVFTIGVVTNPAQIITASNPESPIADVSDEVYTGTPLGNKGIYAWNLTEDAVALTMDGDLDDWATIRNDTFSGVLVAIAFSDTDVYIALMWQDATFSDEVGYWNKTGDMNQTENPGMAYWDYLAGAADMLNMGFTNGTHSDTWIWSAANIVDDEYMLEVNGTGHLDTGTEPFFANSNETDPWDWVTGAAFAGENRPVYENDTTTLLPGDETDVINGSKYIGWYNDDVYATPTASLTDVEYYYTYNASGKEYYTMEVTRKLDTGRADDWVINMSACYFFLGVDNAHSTAGLFVDTNMYKIAHDNDVATVELNPIVSPVTESLLITGTVWDDYAGLELYVTMDGWDDTYGPGTYYDASITYATGNWSFLFIFDEYDMPLGDMEIFVYMDPKYEDITVLNHTLSIDDIKPPQIGGIVDIEERFPAGVPLEEETVTVTVGLSDDYCFVDDITAYLYSYKGTDVALKTDMVQFSSGGSTFTGNITVEHVPGEDVNYTYFIQAWDTNLNKVESARYTFLSLSAAKTPGFGIIIGVFGLAAAAFIIKKAKK